MPGLFTGLEIGKRAMMSHQVSLQTIGHNIANVNTPGYTRQRVRLSTSLPEITPDGPLGTGVKASDVRHIRDLFLGHQYQEAQKGLGIWQYKDKTLFQIEQTLAEPSDNSMGNTLNEFWKVWSELDLDPESGRLGVIKAAEQLIHDFQRLSKSLDELRQATDRDLSNLTSEVNRLTTEIARLNYQIKSQEFGGDQANDLRDMRDLLIDELSNIIDVQVIDKGNGTNMVSMGSMILVDGTSSLNIGANVINQNGQMTHELVWEGTSVKLKNLNGQLAGLIESRDEIIPRYISQLDELARTIVERVNEIHEAGYGVNGTTNVSFFDPNHTTAATMRLNQDIISDMNKIAASQSLDVDVRDSLNAQAIADLRNSLVMSNNTMTINDFYNGVIGAVGVEARETSSFTNNYETLVHQIDNQRQSVQGVSLDEEMANLIKCQHAYDAAARVISVMDKAIETVIWSMGNIG